MKAKKVLAILMVVAMTIGALAGCGGKTEDEPRFAFDQDLYMTGKIPVNYSAGSLETLHSQAYPIFRGAITDMLHDAMEPESI